MLLMESTSTDFSEITNTSVKKEFFEGVNRTFSTFKNVFNRYLYLEGPSKAF